MPKKPTKSAAGYAVGQSDETGMILRSMRMRLNSAKYIIEQAEYDLNKLAAFTAASTSASASALAKKPRSKTIGRKKPTNTTGE